jgi:PAS domain S-box-containing protein
MFNSLKARFIVSFILVQAVFLALITGLNFSSLDNASQTLTKEKVQASSELLVELIKAPLIIYDLATIDDAVKSFSQIKDVVAVKVSDVNDHIVSEFIKKDTFPLSTFHELKNTDKFLEYNKNQFSLHTTDIMFENEKIGHVNFAFNITGMSKSIQDTKNNSYLLISTALFVGVLIAYLIGKNLEGSLEKLARIAQDIAHDIPVDIPSDVKKKDEMGKLFIAMQTMQSHITERTNNLNKSIHELQQFFHALESSAIVSKTDIHGNITYVNDKFVEISGYTRSELLGKNHRLIKHPDMDENVFRELWQTISSKQIFHANIVNRKKNGEAYFVDTTIIPLFDDNDNITEYLAIRYDVTEIAEARNKALSAEKVKSEFLSNMSHEIRTPLNAVLGFVQILKKAETDAKKLSYLNLISGSSQTLLHVINEILDFSKIESGKLLIDCHPFNPLIELSQASKLFMITANEKSINFLCYIDPNIPQCMDSDLTRIKQIMFNFLSNAFKFTPENKVIRIDIRYKNERLCLSVEDEGIGLEPTTLKKIFNVFEQADTSTTRKYGGTGLGLSISKKLAELMNGDILVESVHGKGSTFTLTLPVVLCAVTEEKSIHIDEPLKNKAIDLVYTKERDKEKLDLIKQYLFGLGLTQINTLTEIKDSKADIIVFVPSETINTEIIASKKTALALMAHESSTFDDYHDQISAIIAPYTPLDLITALNASFQEKDAELAQEELSESKGYKGHVLVAEDNRTNQLLIKILLDEYKLQYTIANDGLEAVDAFKTADFDLVLMDENMPNMTGVEAVKEIRRYEEEKQKVFTPIIALTANVMAEDRERFDQAGMNDFLAKPIDTSEFERILKRFLLS